MRSPLLLAAWLVLAAGAHAANKQQNESKVPPRGQTEKAGAEARPVALASESTEPPNLGAQETDENLWTGLIKPEPGRVARSAPVHDPIPVGERNPPPSRPSPGDVAGKPVGHAPVTLPTDSRWSPPAPPGGADQMQRETAMRRAMDSGDAPEARRIIREAREVYPEDKRLESLEKLIADKALKTEPPKLADKIKSLLFNRDAGPQQAGLQAQLATPAALFTAPSAAFKAAGPMPPALAGALSKQSFTKMQLGDYAGAEKDLSATIAKSPENWMAWRLRGLTRTYLNKPVEAESDVLEALRLNPRDGAAHAVRALIRLDTNDPDAAAVEASSAIELNPKDADAYWTRGEALLKLGRDARAFDDFKTATELEPQFAALYRRKLAERGLAPNFAGLARARALYLAAAGLGLLLFGLSMIVKRAQTTLRRPAILRDEDNHPAVGGFRILRRLGQGGMGIVYEAFDETLERRVALKRMRDEIASDARERRRFLKEAKLVAGLRHPNIVEIFQIVEQDSALYLVFEHLEGQPLDELMRGSGGGRLSPSQALPLAREIAEALDFAHERGVIHQDLKPANVFVAGGRAKVMDFGIARRVQDSLSTVSRVEAPGTPAYMAPEQERGGAAGPAADVYAFGACLYQMLSGQLPFSGAGGYFEKAQRRYEPLSKAAGLPAAVDEVIGAALDPDPAKRPADARRLVGALEAALGAASAKA